MKRLISILCVLAMLFTLLPMASFATDESSVDFAVLTTTDMHGKCWDKNVLTDGTESNNMLRVATAVKNYRSTYGANMLVIDNGDLYQGTPVSVVQLNKITTGESDLPAAMALCLAEIGYDVSVLGNHEFNYPWSTMSGIYSYLESRGVPIVTANLYYDGTDGVHEAGENVFTPYLVKTVTIGGNTHKIGVLGFENTDCTRWDVPDNYPGIVFAHPDNTQYSMAWEAQRYIPMMQAEGCEFIIVAYHSGTGATTGTLTFGLNTEGQVSRMIAECEGIDMVVAGHDHSSAYSNTYLKDKNGKDVLVVNGGGKDLTQSIFTFSEDGAGKLAYEVKQTKNLSLGSYTADADLKAKIQPYADMATEYVNQTAGTAVGTWDTSSNYYLQQTDTMDLINGAQIDYGTKYMAKKYDTDEKKAALYAATGLDHIDVDMSSTSAVTNNSYYVKPGPITMKTIVQMYKYDNNVLYLLPLTGQQIKDILEQNASTRLKATVKNGIVSYSTIGEDFTNPVFGGLNFTYDMYQPAGSRVVIEGFSNGRAFELDKTYVVACNSYHLGNTGCGFGAYTTTDSIWNQNDDLAGGNVQEVLFDYISEQGEITTEPFTWSWKLDYTGNLDAPTTLQGDYAAQKTDAIADGDRIVVYYEADSTVIGQNPAENDARLAAVDTVMVGDFISFSADAAVFTVETVEGENDPFLLKADQGYLTAGPTGNSLGFAAEPTDCSQWYLVPVEGGWHIMNVGANYNGNHNQALEWYTGFTTYGVKDTAAYLFNLYKLVDAAKLAAELKNGGKYVIFLDQEELCVGTEENSGGLSAVSNTVSGSFMLPPLDEKTLIVTANIDGEGRIDFVSEDGRHLTSNLAGNGLKLTDALDENNCSLWTLTAVSGGWHVMNVGANYNGNYNQALEYYNGKFTTYGVKDTGAYLFNFYELPAEETQMPEAYHVWIGEEQATPEKLSGEGWRFTPAEGEKPAVLELENYSYSGEGHVEEIGGQPVACAVFYNEEAPLEVLLKGENSLTLNRTEEAYNAMALFCRTANAVIRGEDGASLTAVCNANIFLSAAVAGKGDLRIENLKLEAGTGASQGYNYGVYASEDLYISDCEVKAVSGDAAEHASYAVYALAGALTIENSKLEAESGVAPYSTAIYGAEDTLTISGSEVTAKSSNTTSTSAKNGSHGISSQSSDINILGSNVHAESGSGAYRTDGIYAGGSIDIGGSRVEAVAGDGQYSMGIVAFGSKLDIAVSQVYATGGVATAQSSGLYAEYEMAIRDASTVEAVGKDTTDPYGGSTGLIAYYGCIEITGDCTVTASAAKGYESYGICAYDWEAGTDSRTVTVKGGSVTAIGGEGEESYGIFTSNLIIEKGTELLDAAGQKAAVYGKIRNAIQGKGWADMEAAGEAVAIPESTEGAEFPDYKHVKFVYTIGTVALIVDAGGVEDGGFNQQVHEAAKAWCEAHDSPYAIYVWDDRYDTEPDPGVAVVERAISEGAKVLLLPGFFFTEPTAKTAALHPDVTFILLDVDEESLLEAMGDGTERLPGNVYTATYREEQAGYLAGYAAVAMGYNKLGFLGGIAVPSVVRYGYGFVQGANAAAAALGRTDEVEVRYVYTNQFMPDAVMTEFVGGWYQDGMEVVFACGGGIYASAAEAAAANGGKLIGVDADQKAEIDGAYGAGITLTSAVKNLGATVVRQLNALLKSRFEGGREEKNGIVSDVPAENPVGLAASTVYNESFSEEDYAELLRQILAGDLTISDDVDSKPTAEITVRYQCYTACDWDEPSYEWAEDNSAVTATHVCKNDDSHVETETVQTTAQTTDPGCETEGQTVYTATFTNPAFQTQTKTVKILATGHDWGEPSYEWAADNAACTAKRVCKNDASHVETETVNTTSQTTDPSCEVDGQTVYTATFTNPVFQTQTKTVAIPAIGHDWGEPSYEWAADNATCTAKRVCKRDASHVETEIAKTSSVVTVPASVNAEGERTYTAKFQNPAFQTQTKTEVIPKIQPSSNPFVDVGKSAFYYDAVQWAVNHDPQITNGLDSTHFGPNNTCTRGQVVTFLWRAKGSPEPTLKNNPFVDVGAKAFYYKAVLWAVENKITSGLDKTHFGPTNGCTRGQVVTFLWRAEGSPNPKSLETAFEDVDAKGFYYKAMCWAVENKITTGTSKMTFAPGNTCTRGQIVTFLYRDIEMWRVPDAIQTEPEQEQIVAATIEDDRETAGLSPLEENEVYYRLAKVIAQEQEELYGLIRPDGRKWYTVYNDYSVERPSHAGIVINRMAISTWERIGAEGNYQMIKESPEYEKLMSEEFHEVAVAIYKGSKNYYTVIFLGS